MIQLTLLYRVTIASPFARFHSSLCLLITMQEWKYRESLFGIPC